MQPHTGSGFAYSQTADGSYKRLSREVSVPAAGGSMGLWINYDTEADWDYLFIEARTPGAEDWTTLPDLYGHTWTATGESCAAGWEELHPQLAHYQTWNGADSCTASGTTGAWSAATGRSSGWEEWRVDLSSYAGSEVEISLAYASDWWGQGTGVFVDDVTLPDGSTTSFETGLEGWTAGSPPAGSAESPNTFLATSASRCEPQAFALPGLTTLAARITALSDSGWAVGESEGHAVAWRSPTSIIDTGIGGITSSSGRAITAEAVDVNESGVVVINRRATIKRRLVSQRVLVWTLTDGRVRLPGTKTRPQAWATSLNDAGVVAGAIQGPDHPAVPVVWVDGKLVRLPRPGHTRGAALDINGSGLVVGYLQQHQRSTPWTWRVGGTSGPLKNWIRAYEASQVDDWGRIIGTAVPYSLDAVLWSRRTQKPRVLFHSAYVTDLNDDGFLAVNPSNAREGPGLGRVGRLSGGGSQRTLPAPSSPGEWYPLHASAVARGVTGFAPQGGVTVAGWGYENDSVVNHGIPPGPAIVWTCTQTSF